MNYKQIDILSKETNPGDSLYVRLRYTLIENSMDSVPNTDMK
jgi:hypothetical protein